MQVTSDHHKYSLRLFSLSHTEISDHLRNEKLVMFFTLKHKKKNPFMYKTGLGRPIEVLFNSIM